MHPLRYWSVLLFFLLVSYPTVQLMTKVMGRGWMFRWRHQLNHRRGTQP